MSHSNRFKIVFIGSVFAFAIATRLVIALPINLFGPIGGLADVANELSFVIALLAATRLTDRFNSYFDNRARRLVLEQGFLKWTKELEMRRAEATVAPRPLLKKVA